MTTVHSQYILDSPANLSQRAVDFLRSKSRRSTFDAGLTGDRLGQEIVRVYGEPHEEIVNMLDIVQARFGGLCYESGFFQSNVRYAPVCEPEDPDEELEILYAVETGSPAGASVKASGKVEVGLDGTGILEFADLDALVECDAMFASAQALAIEDRIHVDRQVIGEAAMRLERLDSLNLELVSRASGAHSFWLQGDSLMVFGTDVWARLGGIMPPTLRVWGRASEAVDRVRRALDGA